MKKITSWTIILLFQLFLAAEIYAVSLSECNEADRQCWGGYDPSTGTSSETNDCKKWTKIKAQCMPM